jgi:hypothetical protein
MANDDEGGFHDLTELGELCGCTTKQTRLAEGLLAGLSQVEAAHRAGYAGARDSSQLRSAASAAAQTKPVLALLALAESCGFGVPNAPGDREELIRILWSHARSKDKQHSISASKVLNELIAQETANSGPSEPEDVLRQLAEVSPVIAAAIAAKEGIAFKPSPEQSGKVDAFIRDWIAAHPHEVRAILDAPAAVNGATFGGLDARA